MEPEKVILFLNKERLLKSEELVNTPRNLENLQLLKKRRVGTEIVTNTLKYIHTYFNNLLRLLIN